MITIENVSMSFDGKPVLRDVSVSIREGETFAVIGRSGSGKSVLLKLIVGLLRPDGGRILVDGEDVHALPYGELRRLRRRFGLLFQGGALFDSLSALDNVAFPLRVLGRSDPATARRRAEECLELVELSHVAGQRPNELSGGQQKRVALARAIALEPAYLFYDEPTSGLDPQTSKTIDQLITSLAERLGVTSIVITHDIHSVLRVADRIGFLLDGRMRWVGTVEELHRATDPELLDFVRTNEYLIGTPS